MEANSGTGRRGHETRDVNIRRLLGFGAALIVLIMAGLLASEGVLHYFEVRQPLGPPASPFENVRTLPPAPRLQVAPVEDLAHYQAAQASALNSYGWVDQKAGVVRIPIDRAMDLLLERGLPARARAAQQGAAEIKPGEVQQYTVPKGYTPEPSR